MHREQRMMRVRASFQRCCGWGGHWDRTCRNYMASNDTAYDIMGWGMMGKDAEVWDSIG